MSKNDYPPIINSETGTTDGQNWNETHMFQNQLQIDPCKLNSNTNWLFPDFWLSQKQSSIVVKEFLQFHGIHQRRLPKTGNLKRAKWNVTPPIWAFGGQ